MRWPGPIDAKWLRRWTIRLGVASFVVLSFPALTVLCLISIVGIPLGFAMMLMPTAFEIVGLAYLAQRLVGRDTRLATAASFALALTVLAALAAVSNAGLERRAAELLAGDVDTLETPLRAKTIGLVSLDYGWFAKGQSRCDELCQRLLLSGAATRVVVPAAKPPEGAWNAETPALGYRLEQRATCPPVQLPGRTYPSPAGDAKADEAMRLAIASGRCLLEENATLGDTETVVTVGRVKRGENDFSAGLSLFADTVSADRAAVHVRTAAGFEERYRWTGVRILLHPFIPIPTLVGGHELNMRPGFLRNEEVKNMRDFAPGQVDPARFVRDELGLDVSVPPPAEPGTLIARALDEPGPLPPVIRQVVEDFFAKLRDAKQIDEATRAIAFRALDDPRVPAPRETWALVRACEKAGDAVNAELAGILFRKIMATDPQQREDHPSYLGYLATYLGRSIAMLPPAAVLAHRAELERIAREPARRWRGYPALAQLAAFGADAVPTMLFLVDAGIALQEAARGERSRDREDWDGPYRSGLVGLCRLGSEGSAALEPMMEKLRAGTLPESGLTDDLLLKALVRIGADPQAIRSRFVADESAAPRFDRDVDRARTRPECHL